MMQQYQLFIDGGWRDSQSRRWFDTVNPYSGEVWARIPQANDADVEAAVSAAHRGTEDRGVAGAYGYAARPDAPQVRRDSG